MGYEAVDIYKKLGFAITDALQNKDGIRYVPMEYRMLEHETSK